MKRIEEAAAVKEEVVLMECGRAARLLECSGEWVRQLVKKGRMKALRTEGGQLLFEPAEVERLRVERAQRASKKAGP